MELRGQIDATDIEVWRFTIHGDHNYPADYVPADPAPKLRGSPQIAPSILVWSEKNRPASIAASVTIPEFARQQFSARFLSRFEPTAEQAKSIVYKRVQRIKKRSATTGPVSRLWVTRNLARGPKRSRRPNKRRSKRREQEEEEEAEEGEEEEGEKEEEGEETGGEGAARMDVDSVDEEASSEDEAPPRAQPRYVQGLGALEHVDGMIMPALPD